VRRAPAAHLVLAGAASGAKHLDLIRNEASRLGLQNSVSVLGPRDDVEAILRMSDIGVLSSRSEGLPLALIEYGMAGLPAVATRIGQCPEVLDEGRAGSLVTPGEPAQLAEALLDLVESPKRRAEMAERLRNRVQELYSPGPIMERVCQVYDAVLATN
jgi:glycosyltransferase involved in cell wall biosynthesis